MTELMLDDDECLIFGPYFVHQSVENRSTENLRLTLQLRVNDVATLPEMTTAFTAKATDYLLEKREALFAN